MLSVSICTATTPLPVLGANDGIASQFDAIAGLAIVQIAIIRPIARIRFPPVRRLPLRSLLLAQPLRNQPPDRLRPARRVLLLLGPSVDCGELIGLQADLDRRSDARWLWSTPFLWLQGFLTTHSNIGTTESEPRGSWILPPGSDHRVYRRDDNG